MPTLDFPEGRGTRLSRAERAALSDKKLIQAALELIAESGIEKVTLRSIGERAGYSRGLVNYRFGTKEALLQEATRRLVGQWIEDVNASMRPGQGGLSALLQFIAHTRAGLQTSSTESRAYYALVYAVLGPLPELRDDLASIHAKIRERLSTWIRAAIDDGEIHEKVDPESTATWVLAAARGIAYQWFIDPDGVDLQRSYDSLADALCNALQIGSRTA